MKSSANIVLFYPRLGWMDAFVLDLPLSIVYAAYECQKNGLDVRFVDQRIEGRNWPRALAAAIDPQTILVGFSAMSGNPIRHALAATRLVKERYPRLPTVWGGTHVTVCPNEALHEPAIDYIIRGNGAAALWDLVRHLSAGDPRREQIEGLGWLENGRERLNAMSRRSAFAPLTELPLDRLHMSRYTRFNYRQKVYTLFTSFGCPHPCRFCFVPVFSKHLTGERWFPYEAADVIEHIVTVARRYDIGYLSLLDENFFLDLRRAAAIFRGVADQGVRLTWGIRGARIDDLDRADDEFFRLMSDSGVKQIMIGAESGSPRMLEIMKKGITVEQTVRVNRKLARFPRLCPYYNFLSGLPDETVADMYQTVDLILRLMKENPQASFSGLNQLIPFPGSELYDRCLALGHREPQTLEGWAGVDMLYNRDPVPWLDRRTESTLHAIQAAVMFADAKAERELLDGASREESAERAGRGWFMAVLFQLILWATRLYRPVALFRLRRRFFRFPLDYRLIKFAVTAMARVSSLKRRANENGRPTGRSRRSKSAPPPAGAIWPWDGRRERSGIRL